MISFGWGGSYTNFVELGMLGGGAAFQRGDELEAFIGHGLIHDLRYFATTGSDGRRHLIAEIVVCIC